MIKKNSLENTMANYIKSCSFLHANFVHFYMLILLKQLKYLKRHTLSVHIKMASLRRFQCVASCPLCLPLPISIKKPSLEVIKLFSCSTQLRMNLQLLIKAKIFFLAVKLLVGVFILLIKVKMPTIFWHFSIYKQDKFCAQLSWEWKKFNNLKAWYYTANCVYLRDNSITKIDFTNCQFN